MMINIRQLVVLSALSLCLFSVINGASLAKRAVATHNSQHDSNELSNYNSRCNCTNDTAVEGPVCGSNGLTYQSEYELCEYNCEHETNITIKEHKECRNCTKYSAELQSTGAARGISSDLLIRCFEGRQTVQDLISYPYQPVCQTGPGKSHFFAPQQRNRRCGLYWCATPDGEPVQGTISRKQYDCREGYCIDNNGEYRNNKEIFQGECGSCQCVDGNVICITDYCTYEGASTLNQLKSDMKKMYLLQRQYVTDEDRYTVHPDISLVFIRTHDIDFHNLKEVMTILEWKFNYYDKDQNEKLSSTDRSFIIDEAFRLFKTKTIIDPLKQYLNTDNGGMTKEEFVNFFMTENSEASGSSEQPAISLT